MRPKAERIAEAWEKYRVDVVPENAPDNQVRQCRRSFYAGAHFILSDMLDLLDPAEEPTEGDLNMIADLHDELLTFAADVVGGRA